MNIDPRQPVSSRLADLNPFDIKVMFSNPAPKPRKGAPLRSERFTTNLESDPQLGCVDWYLWKKSKLPK